jgi:hypothetical protein
MAVDVEKPLNRVKGWSAPQGKLNLTPTHSCLLVLMKRIFLSLVVLVCGHMGASLHEFNVNLPCINCTRPVPVSVT